MTAPAVSIRHQPLAVELCVLRALEVAGKRARLSREQMGVKCASYRVHVEHRLAVQPEGCDRLLAGAWTLLRDLVPDEPRLIEGLDWYVRELICNQTPHTRSALNRVLEVVFE